MWCTLGRILLSLNESESVSRTNARGRSLSDLKQKDDGVQHIIAYSLCAPAGKPATHSASSPSVALVNQYRPQRRISALGLLLSNPDRPTEYSVLIIKVRMLLPGCPTAYSDLPQSVPTTL